MGTLNFKGFMKKYNSKDHTMLGSDLQRVFNYPTYLRDPKLNSDKGFVNIDNGIMMGTHWTRLYIKDNKS